VSEDPPARREFREWLAALPPVDVAGTHARPPQRRRFSPIWRADELRRAIEDLARRYQGQEITRREYSRELSSLRARLAAPAYLHRTELLEHQLQLLYDEYNADEAFLEDFRKLAKHYSAAELKTENWWRDARLATFARRWRLPTDRGRLDLWDSMGSAADPESLRLVVGGWPWAGLVADAETSSVLDEAYDPTDPFAPEPAEARRMLAAAARAGMAAAEVERQQRQVDEAVQLAEGQGFRASAASGRPLEPRVARWLYQRIRGLTLPQIAELEGREDTKSVAQQTSAWAKQLSIELPRSKGGRPRASRS
jgi:hypothetical protein